MAKTDRNNSTVFPSVLIKFNNVSVRETPSYVIIVEKKKIPFTEITEG